MMMDAFRAREGLDGGGQDQSTQNEFLRGKSQEMTSILYLNLFQCFPDSGKHSARHPLFAPPPDSSKIP